MTEHRIVEVRPAGDEHQVVTVAGGRSSYCLRPCSKCPWRIDAVGEFPADAFRHSASTAYDMATNEFACHRTGVERPSTCAGYLLRGSHHNMAMRLKLIQGKIDMSDVSDGGVELFDSYREMAEANGVPADDPALDRCRP